MINSLLPPQLRKQQEEEYEQKKLKQEKLDFIQKYIDEAESLKDCKDAGTINQFCERCIGLFSEEIAGFKSKIMVSVYQNYSLNQVNLIAEKLKKYKIDFQINRQSIAEDRSINFTNSVNTDISTTIEVSLTQTLTNVINLEDSELSAEDKITLQKMLTEIEALKTQKKDKKKLSEKIKDLGKWIFEKGIPAIASCLPYIAQTIETLKG